MAKAMGKSRLSPEEESVLVDMMMSKATVECHAEQLAGALHDIKEIADNPSGSVDMKRLERVKAAFSTCPNGDHDD